MGEFRMPSLGADMERGKVVEWLVQPGEYVHRGDIIAAVDTEKTVMEVESFEDGVLAEYLVDLGETVPVGTPIARLTGTPADVAPLPGASARAAAEAAATVGAAPAGEAVRAGAAQVAAGAAVPAGAAAGAGADAGAPASAGEPAAGAERSQQPGHVAPPVRHLAQQLGVDLEQVHGTGRHGAITRADVQAASEAARVAPGTGTRGPRAHAGHARSSPRARRLAGELGVDLSTVRGSGPEGAVTEADVRRASAGAAAEARREAAVGGLPAEAPSTEPRPAAPDAHTERAAERPPAGAAASGAAASGAAPTEAAERIASLRRAVGSLMARSKREIPHYYLSTTIDMAAAVSWMREANVGRPIASRLVPSALLLAASARAAKEIPEVNGFFVDGEFRPSAAVHLGVAVALRGGGLVAPAIHDADALGVDALMEQLRDLVARARAGRLQRAEMADPTITVTNLGDLGVESVFGVIYAPQVALVGFGRVLEQPRAHEGMLGVHPTVTATLSADHRVSDGLRGGRFLARIDELLQRPEEL